MKIQEIKYLFSSLLILSIFLTSCNECEKTYFPNGKVKSLKCRLVENYKLIKYDSLGLIQTISFIKENGNIDSMETVFYKNKIKILSFKTGVDTSNGSILKYYSNGQIKEKFNIINNQIVGDYYYYDLNGEIKMRESYIIINNKSKLNEILVFNNKGIALSDSSKYVKIKPLCDTIKIEDNFKFRLYFLCKEEYIYCYTANFDKNFNLKDSSSFQEFKNPDDICMIKPAKKGNDTLRIVIKLLNPTTNSYFQIYKEQIYYVK